MQIIKSELAGFCFGVRRASDLIYEQIKKNDKKIYTLGEIIHNDDFNSDLVKNGVTIINEEQLCDIDTENSILFIRAHGVPKHIYQKLEKFKISYIDTTCPYVLKIQDIVKNQSDSPFFIISGDKNHPEVESFCSFASNDSDYVVCKDSEEFNSIIKKIPDDDEKRKILLSQTTQNINEWKTCIEIAKKLYTNLTIFDTICNVTEKRQNEAEKLSKEVDLMIIIGGNKSSNTKKLTTISSRNCKSIQINNASEISPDILRGIKKVGITAGASTPDRIIEEVIKKMSENINETVETKLTDDMSFEELLDKSFKFLNTGDKVTGTITYVLPTEIHLDLGTKHTGILAFDDVTDDSSVELQKEYKPGDKITVQVLRVNDAEGTAKVSLKKITSIANWEKVKEAHTNNETLEGKVKEVVKGGVIVFWNAVRIFIPATQTGIPRDGDMNVLAGTTVKFRIIDIDDAKKRAVGSIKVITREERKAREEKFWAEIEVGKTYTGPVKSIMSYGAFVDLGGVDGMVHITELSWYRIKHPSEIVNVGDVITVYVKEFDAENRKISLGYKTDDTNPWTLFINQYKINDVVKVKIVSMMPFGAFAQILPGVDGLIHISQISNKKLGKPADVLSVGQEVDVMITDINEETKKVSLSIRALITEEADETNEVEEIEEAAEEQAE